MQKSAHLETALFEMQRFILPASALLLVISGCGRTTALDPTSSGRVEWRCDGEMASAENDGGSTEPSRAILVHQYADPGDIVRYGHEGREEYVYIWTRSGKARYKVGLAEYRGRWSETFINRCMGTPP